MIKKNWKRITLFLIGLDVVVLGGGSLVAIIYAALER